MKIVCDNCGAKYSIADEKVAGKVFKIRCKKCTNVIVVRGDQIAAEVSAEPGRPSGYDYGGDAVWHVVVDGDQQGPFDPAKLGEMLSAGTIDWEAYVWREGFEGWKPAKDVSELVTTLGGSPASTGGSDPFAGSAEGASAFAGSGDAGADLFAPSPGAGATGGDDDVVASPTPSPRAAAPAASGDANMTGQRNENSVLFSLSNLQALATGEEEDAAAAAAGGPAPSGPLPGAAAGEGSGLIDIRALATATSATSGSSGAAGGGGGAPADLLSIGGTSGGVTTGLGGPVLAPAQAEPEKSNKGMAIGLAVVALLVVGLLGVVVKMMMEDKPQQVVTREIVREVAAPSAPATANPAAPEAAAMAVGTAEDEDEPTMASAMSSARMRSSTGSMSSASMSSTTMRRRSGGSDIDSLLDSALSGMMTTAMMSSSSGSNLPEQPSRNDVQSALRGASSRVASCGGGTASVANAAITFGNNGRVRGVRVTGVPPNVASCVARGVRGARVPPFRRSTFLVNYPFRVR